MKAVGLHRVEVEGSAFYISTAMLEIKGRLRISDLMKLVSDLELGGVRVVAVNPSYLVGEAHLATAVEYALRAFKRGVNAARSFHVEVMLFAAATHEISKAIPIFKPTEGLGKIAVACVSRDAVAAEEAVAEMAARLEARVLPLSCSEIAAKRLVEALSIKTSEVKATYSESFCEAVEKLILSRMALEYISR